MNHLFHDSTPIIKLRAVTSWLINILSVSLLHFNLIKTFFFMMMMGLSKVSIFSVFVMWVCGYGHGHVFENFISWNDMWVDEQRLTMNSIKDLGVIVVDQHGNGHSRTVQGAVDMVPYNNSKRIKIFIRPGIYRYIYTIIYESNRSLKGENSVKFLDHNQSFEMNSPHNSRTSD